MKTFKTLDELHEYNNKAFEQAFGSIKYQRPQNPFDNNSWDALKFNARPHDVFNLDWSSYSSLDFADRFLPYIKNGYKGKAMWMYDGADLFSGLRKVDQKLFKFDDNKYLISLINYTYPKGVLAESKKDIVRVTEHEVLTFIEMDKYDDIDISFKFGKRFKDYLERHFKEIGVSKNVSDIENRTYSTDKQSFKDFFNNQLVHYSMMSFILDILEVEKPANNEVEVNENDFIPIVSLNSEQEEKGFKVVKPNAKDTLVLSEYIDEDKRKIVVQNVKIEQDSILEFKILKGNQNANDNEGNITIKAKGVEIISEKKSVRKLKNKDYDFSMKLNEVQYNWIIKIKLLERTLEKDAYIDFFANDDDLFFKSVSNVHCGRVKISQGKKCTCKISRPAKSFKQLINLVKQSEEVLIENGYSDIEDRISIIRGIYYGTEWSLDYNNEQSKVRNNVFNIYTGSSVVADARRELKCASKCKGKLFDSLYNSFEVFEGRYKAVDFGHLIIGIDSRRSWAAINVSLNGGTGLENNTWVGDLGGGTAKLALDRVKNPKKRAKSMFPVGGSSYGSMVNLEGDIAAYIVGMDSEKESKIDDLTDNFETIHEALKDYFDKKWKKRAYYFLKMIDGEFDGNTLTNRDELVEYCAETFEDFAFYYAALRYTKEELVTSSGYYKGASEEIASIFIDGLIHVVEKPNDMITARTDPEPQEKEETSLDRINDTLEKIKEWF